MTSGATKIGAPLAIVFGTVSTLSYLGREDLIPASLNSSHGLILCSLGLGLVFKLSTRAWRTIQEELEMRSLGAVRIPVVKGRLPGSIDFLVKLMKSFQSDYVGQFIEDLSVNHGHRFRLNILGDEMVGIGSHFPAIYAADYAQTISL